jgi:hypothetical protein
MLLYYYKYQENKLTCIDIDIPRLSHLSLNLFLQEHFLIDNFFFILCTSSIVKLHWDLGSFQYEISRDVYATYFLETGF